MAPPAGTDMTTRPWWASPGGAGERRSNRWRAAGGEPKDADISGQAPGIPGLHHAGGVDPGVPGDGNGPGQRATTSPVPLLKRLAVQSVVGGATGRANRITHMI